MQTDDDEEMDEMIVDWTFGVIGDSYPEVTLDAEINTFAGKRTIRRAFRDLMKNRSPLFTSLDGVRQAFTTAYAKIGTNKTFKHVEIAALYFVAKSREIEQAVDADELTYKQHYGRVGHLYWSMVDNGQKAMVGGRVVRFRDTDPDANTNAAETTETSEHELVDA